MEKNKAAKWVVFAYGLPGHANPGQPVTGDAANITANIRIDGGAANAVDDVNPAELEDGYYIFDTTAAESNGDLLLLAPVSSTANVQVIAVPGVVYTRPPNFNALGIAADGDISGNVDGAVASVTGAVGSVTADVTTDAASRNASKATGFSTFDHTTNNVTLAAATHAGAVIPTVSTLTGHTPQTSDHTAGIAAVKSKTDSLTFTTANQVDSNPLSIASSGKAATNLRASALGIEPGSAVTGTLSTTQMTTDLTETTDGHYIGRVIIWTSGNLANQGTDITGYTGSSKLLTYTSTTGSPANGDTFVIV